MPPRLSPVVLASFVAASAFSGWWLGAAWAPRPGGSTKRGRAHALGISGIVTVEDIGLDEVHDADDGDLLASQLPRGPADLFSVLAGSVSEWVSCSIGLAEARRAQYRDGEYASDDANGDENDSSAVALEVYRSYVEHSVVLLSLVVRVIGLLLALVVPLSLTAYCMLSEPFNLVLQQGFLGEQMSGILAPLDRVFSPVLIAVARVLGLAQSEVLCEDGHGSECSKRARRVLLGITVVNVAVSAAAVLALACFVAAVRISSASG